MTTDVLKNALAFAASGRYSGNIRVILDQAMAACRTLAKEVKRLQAGYMTLDNGYVRCLYCKSWWYDGEPSAHHKSCILAEKN